MSVDIETIEIKGLTRGEIRRLRAEGILLQEIEKLPDDKRDDAMDRVFALACPQVDPDSLTPAEALPLYVRIVQTTYVSEDMLKKFGSPLPLTSPAGGDMIAENADAQDCRPNDTAPEPEKTPG